MNPAQVSLAASINTLPWVIKPVWGIISDTYPFFGYRRKSYLIFFGVIGFVLWQCIALITMDETSAILDLLFIQISIAFCNVIGGNKAF